jgi:AcrR family transcriptional regulator
MENDISNSERYRRERAHQVEERRNAIIAAATALFLEKGLEQTSMLDIANQAHISKVTLYRYFPNRDPIAFEVAAKMLNTIMATASQSDGAGASAMDGIRGLCLGMIDKFTALRGAYRYVGMFDHLYGDRYPSEELASWYKQRIFGLTIDGVSPIFTKDFDGQKRTKIVTMFNMIMSFLQKMAARGELIAEEQETPLQAQLDAFKEIILIYLESLQGEQNE